MTSNTPMFHVKHLNHRGHRGALAVILVAVALLAAGCAGEITPPKGWASPVPAIGDTLLVQSGIGRLTAVKSDGTRVTDFAFTGAPSRDFLGRQRPGPATPLYATPLIDGSAVYIASYEGRVARLDMDERAIAEEWAVDLAETVVATPILHGDRLYVSTESGRLHVLNATNGTAISTTRPTPGRVWGAPASEDDRIFIGTLDSSEIIALNTATDATEWRHTGTGATTADLVIDGDMLLVPSFDRGLHSLDLASGEQTWEFIGDGWFVGRPLVTADAIYAGTMSGSVYALNRGGTEQWHASYAALEFRAAPLLLDGVIVAVGRDATFIGLDAATGEERWTRAVEDAEVEADGVAMDGALFYSTNDYRLLRVDPATGDIQTFNIQPPSGDQ